MDAKIKKHNKVITAGRRLNSGNYDTCKTEQYDEIRKTFLSLFKHDFDEVKGRGNYNLDDHISHYIGIKRNWFEYAEKYFFKTTEVKKLLITISDDCITELIDHTSGYMNKKDIVECHIDYCLVCEESRGDLIYCDCCIRAYHCECIGLKKNYLPKSPWQCTKCKQKGRKMTDDVVNGKKSFKVISKAFRKLVTSCPGSGKQLVILSKIYEMVQNLLKYDFGSYFAKPIKLRSSCQVITDPKDLGTICDNMLNGVYCQNIYLKLSDKDDSAESVSRYAAFDKVILTVLKDVEKVWQNCFQRNEENTICYRMAQIMRDKCYKICQKSFSKILSPYIKNGLQKYIKECQEGNDDAHVKDNDDIDNDDDVDDIVEQQVDDNDQDINDKDNDDVVNDDKTKIIPPSIIDSSSKPIFISPPIIDSSIDKSTVTNLNKNNNNELVNEEPVNEDNNNNNVDVDSEESTSDESNDESCGNDKNLKFNNDDDDDDEDSEDDSINRTSSDESIDESRGNDKKKMRNKDDDEEKVSSDESNVKLTDIMPLTIGTNTVNTQGIAISVHIHGKNYSNKTLQKTLYVEKRFQKGC